MIRAHGTARGERRPVNVKGGGLNTRLPHCNARPLREGAVRGLRVRLAADVLEAAEAEEAAT